MDNTAYYGETWREEMPPELPDWQYDCRGHNLISLFSQNAAKLFLIIII